MPITACPSCQAKLRVADDAVGKAVKCPKCAKLFRIGPAAVRKANAPSVGPSTPTPLPAAKTRPPARPLPKMELPEEPVLGENDLEVVDDAPAPPPVEDLVNNEEGDLDVGSKAARGASSLPLEEPVYGEGDLDVVDEPADEDEAPEEPAVKKKGDPFKGQGVPDTMRQQVRGELSRDEKIVWVGRSSVRILLARAWIGVIVGVVFLLAGGGLFVGGLCMNPFKQPVPALAMAGFGFVFACVGVLACFTRYFVKRFQAHREVYVLTNRRAIVLEHGGRNVRSYNTFQLAQMDRKDSAMFQGAGDLIFETELQTQSHGGSRGGASTVRVPHGFLMIENVRTVEKLIRETLVDHRIDRTLS